MNLRSAITWLCLAFVGLSGLAPGAARAAPTFPYRWPDYSVLPIFFVPRDWSTSSGDVQAEAAAIRSAMREIQGYYRVKLGSMRTFRLNDVEVVQADGFKEAYGITWNGRNIYADGVEVNSSFEGAVVAELHRRGYPTPPAQNESGYSVVIFVKGAGGWAGGRELGSGDGGWAILGDWAIDSLDGSVPEGAYWWSGRRLQTGAAAHELGHVFGLPHPDAYGGSFASSVMGNWWEFPTIGFNANDISLLFPAKNAFFPSVPGYLLQGMWRGNQGFSRTVPLNSNGVPNFGAASGWSGPVAISGLPGAGDMQGQGDFIFSNGRTMMQSMWRGDQGFTRTVSMNADGSPNWAAASAWSGPALLSGLPGSGSLQASEAVVIAFGRVLRQSFWRGNQGFTRTVPMNMDGTPNWAAASAWSGPTSSSVLPGSGDVQSLSETLYPNGQTMLQGIWRGNQGFTRTIPMNADGTPNFGAASAWSAPIALSGLPGSGSIQSQTDVVYRLFP
ncbi:hypothetical protein F0U60_07870 [Archangium minus]|uniref:Uncharacterized protein n=1 Tax=Archangium minus TaxID=83450 RepID=A0ABY9WJM6_9BACT|nr:hypothetical protein F0U60_07870 [Archangium minus]